MTCILPIRRRQVSFRSDTDDEDTKSNSACAKRPKNLLVHKALDDGLSNIIMDTSGSFDSSPSNSTHSSRRQSTADSFDSETTKQEKWNKQIEALDNLTNTSNWSPIGTCVRTFRRYFYHPNHFVILTNYDLPSVLT